MMPLLASLHAIAAKRGDGLRPELVRLLNGPGPAPATNPTAHDADRETHGTTLREPESVVGDAAAKPEEILHAGSR
jgi:hypothetical protein